MAQHIFRGEGAPSSTPTALGQHYIDTLNKVHYFSVGTDTAADWAVTTVEGGGTYTDEQAQDAIGAAISAGTQDGVSASYSDVGNSISFTNLDKGSTAVATHVGLSDPHSQYLKESDNLLIKPEIVTVKVSNAGAGEFTSIAAAAASILDSGPTKPYVIKVGVGEFTEPVINLPEYVSVEGEAIQATKVFTATNSQHLFVMATGCELSFMSLYGLLGSGYAAIKIDNVGDFVQTHKLSIYDFDIGIEHNATSASSNLYVEYTDINGDYTNAVKATSSGGFSNRTQLENFYTYESANANAITISGTGTALELQLFACKMFNEATQKCIVVNNGVNLRCNGLDIQGAEVGIEIQNIGAGSSIATLATAMKGNTLDYVISHPSATGSIFGGTNKDKVQIDSSASISVLLLDTVNRGVIMNGPLYYSQAGYGDVTEVSQLWVNTPPIGVIKGGTLSAGTGLTLNIAEGYGYTMNGTEPNDVLTKREWANSTLTLTANTSNYVYMNGSGVFVSNSAYPDTEENMLLGKVTTNATDILYINQTPLKAHHWSNQVAKSWREAIGPLYVSGSTVTETGTRSLLVTGGHYNYAEHHFHPTGGTGVTFDAWYRSGVGSTYTRQASQTVVSNTLYDDGTGTLATIPAGKHVKHLLYILGEGADEKYILIYAQAYYNTAQDAADAALPVAPSFIADNFVRLASIVVGPDSSAFHSVIDERPRVGFAASSSGGGGGVTDHTALTNLTTGDAGHTQFLMLDGSKSMTGGLNMGTNAITNVGLVDGVDVSAHASRHLPNGADPLATGVPENIGSSNAEGILNSFARADHIHNHGSHTEPTNHAVATTSANGFMSAADKTKLDIVSSTELGYLAGVTSDIQDQLDAKQPTGNYITALTGDVTASGPGSASATLANSGVVAGTYSLVTVDAKGRVTFGSNFGSVVRYSYSTTTTATNSTVTYGSVAELTSVSLTAGLYRFRFFGLVQSTATNTGGIGVRLGAGTATLSTVYAQWSIPQAADGTDKYFNYDQLSAITNLTSASTATANTNAVCTGDGIFRVTSAGTVAIQLRSETAGVTATIGADAVFLMELV